MSENTIQPGTIQTGEVQTPMKRLAKYTLQAMILLPIIAGIFAYRLWVTVPTTPTEAEFTTVSAKTLEERFGLQISLIAVTAGGGIVDFRYKVVDKDKAEFLLGDSHTMPTLMVEESGISLSPPDHTMKHNTKLESGKSYFQLYPNTQNAVRPGSHVSVVIGSIRLEPIIAQ